MKNIFAVILLLLVSTTAQAGLILHISPDGTGGTRWQFSGSSVVLSSGSSNAFWGEGSGTMSNTQNGSYGITSGSGTLFSTSFGFANVINVWASQHFYDGVGPRTGFIFWDSGDTISWVGDLTSNLPFSGLNLGSITTSKILYNSILSESLTITVSNTAISVDEVPAPAPFVLLGLGLVALGFSRRKA